MVLIRDNTCRTSVLSQKDTQIKEPPFYKLFGIILVSNALLNLPLETRPLYNDFQKEALVGKP